VLDAFCIVSTGCHLVETVIDITASKAKKKNNTSIFTANNSPCYLHKLSQARRRCLLLAARTIISYKYFYGGEMFILVHTKLRPQ
jgi:hypothetical protein